MLSTQHCCLCSYDCLLWQCIAEEEVVAVADGDDGFDELLHGCGTLCDQRTEEMEKLQEQLEKYGFRKKEGIATSSKYL